jgi:hypothetical protein
MAVINLRGVPDDLARALKVEAAERGKSLRDVCIERLQIRTGDKTALPEKNRGSSGGAPARGPESRSVLLGPKTTRSQVPAGHRLVAAAEVQQLLGEKASPDTARSLTDHALAGEQPRRAGKSPIRVKKGQSLAEVLPVSEAKAAAARETEAYLAEHPPKAEWVSDAALPEIRPKVPEPARCKVCFGLLPYHQIKGCKG